MATLASKRVWALVSGFPSDKRNRRLLMIVSWQAAIDDSGSEPQSPFFVLGGFIAPAEAWAAFADEWDAALKEPPGLDYFKMAEAASLAEDGQFSPDKGWTEAKRDDRLITLARIIKNHAKIRIATAMPNDAFYKHISSLPASARTLSSDNPYGLLFMRTILAAGVFGSLRGIDSPCDFIFDEQLGFSDEVHRRWPQFKEILEKSTNSDLKNFVGSRPIYRDEKEFLPLQAADLYAWQIRHHLVINSRFKNQKIQFPPSRVLVVLEPIPEIFWRCDEAELLRLREHLLKVGELFIAEYPDIPLIPRSEDSKERRRLRRKARRAIKAYPVSPPSDAKSC